MILNVFVPCNIKISFHWNLFQHDNALIHKERSEKTWCVKVVMEELKWPAKSSDLKPHWTPSG